MIHSRFPLCTVHAEHNVVIVVIVELNIVNAHASES